MYNDRMNDKELSKRPELAQSDLIKRMPKACGDELAAVELMEEVRWGHTPCCVHCGSVNVYKMVDAKTGERNKRFLWRCHDCHKQYTVRIGAVYEESRLPLRHWCYAFWRGSTSKKGAAAMEIMRHCQISYKSALFLMHRVRWAMAPANAAGPKLGGIVECDTTSVGGKPRPPGQPQEKRKWHTTKVPVLGMVERGGKIKRRVVADVTGKTLKDAIRESVDPSASIMTDEFPSFNGIGDHFAGGHRTINHSLGIYAQGDVTTNTIESSFALVKRGLIGIHHAVSKKHLHRYLAHYDFLWNHRQLNDGERTALAIKAADGKRLLYREPVDPPQDGEQLPFWPQ